MGKNKWKIVLMGGGVRESIQRGAEWLNWLDPCGYTLGKFVNIRGKNKIGREKRPYQWDVKIGKQFCW